LGAADAAVAAAAAREVAARDRFHEAEGHQFDKG
jgi:hypothetical protein